MSNEMTEELAVRESYTPSRVVGGIPYFEEYLKLAERICKTAMVPSALRNRPDEVLAVVMYGAELGIGPMQAMQQVNFIEGKPSMAPELMRALIRTAGHKLNITQSNTECIIEGERCDTGETGTASFTIADAEDAGLCKIVDGKAQARSKEGKKLTWEKYTKDMLLARATSRIARMMFSDVIAGMSYTPEEVESFSPPAESKPPKPAKASATVTRSAPVKMATEEEIAHLKRLLAMLEDDDKAEVKASWQRLGIPPLTQGLTDDQCDEATQMVIEVLNRLAPEIIEGEIVSGENKPTAPDAVVVDPSTLEAPMITNPQIGKIRVLVGQAGVDKDDIHQHVSDILHRQISSLKDLTKAEATRTIDQLLSDTDN
jgi:hypothetical protein